MRRQLIAFLSPVLFAGAIYGQTEFDQLKAKYPTKNGVFLKQDQTVNITLDKNGQPLIEITHDEERMFLNDNFRHYAEESIGYSSFLDLQEVSAYTHVSNGDKVKKIKVDQFFDEKDESAMVFHDDSRIKSFFYPGLDKGAKTTLNYTQVLNEPQLFGSFFFSSYLPVESAKYTIQTPADMEISYKLFGKQSEKVKYTVVTKGNIKTHSWEAKELDELNFESNSVDVKYYATHVIVYINTYKFKNQEHHIIRNVDDLHSYYREFVKGVNDQTDPELKQLADSLTVGLTSNDEKVKAIFYWVQDNIKYIAFEDGYGGFIPRKADLVCDRRFGDCKDMASILYAMINSIGIPAYYTWIGSREIPYKYSEVPTPSADNHMICTYISNGEYIFLDATGQRLPYGMPTAFIQGKEALISLSESEYKIVEIPVISYTECQTIDTVYATINNTSVEGTGEVYYKGYISNFLSDYIRNMSDTELEMFSAESFMKGNNKCKAAYDEIRGEDDRDSPLEIDYHFSVPDYVRVNGDELYLNPFLKKYFSDGKINVETNKVDKESLYEEMNRNVIIYEFPEGYKLDFIPENYHISNDYFTSEVTYKVNEEDETIEVQTYFETKTLILPVDMFNEWNTMIKQLNKAYSELIIFKKK